MSADVLLSMAVWTMLSSNVCYTLLSFGASSIQEHNAWTVKTTSIAEVTNQCFNMLLLIWNWIKAMMSFNLLQICLAMVCEHACLVLYGFVIIVQTRICLPFLPHHQQAIPRWFQWIEFSSFAELHLSSIWLVVLSSIQWGSKMAKPYQNKSSLMSGIT